MGNLNHHHEGDLIDMDYFCLKIFKQYNSGKSVEDIAIENRIPMKTVSEAIDHYKKLYN